MKKEKYGVIMVMITIFCLLILTQISFGAKIKIKVVVENATIRSDPSLESEVIQEDLALGTTFETEKMADDWYEVRFRNSLGALVSGYIHKMYVEILEEQPPVKPEEVRKPVEPKVKPAVPAEPQRKKQPKGDFAVMGGMVTASFIPDSSSYSDSWSESVLKSVTESGTITHKIGNPMGLGISLSYLFLGGLGIQARVDYNLTKKFVPEESFSGYNITWSWTTAGPYSREETWSAAGEISVIPLSLNLIYKVQGGGFIVPYISGGISYFAGKVKADTFRGYGFTWTDDTNRYIDYLDIPLVIDASLSGIGFNAGGGLDLVFTRNIALSLEGIYFIGRTIEEFWYPLPGTYPGNNFSDVTWAVEQDFMETIVDQIPPLKIKTSFLKFQAGIKFLF